MKDGGTPAAALHTGTADAIAATLFEVPTGSPTMRGGFQASSPNQMQFEPIETSRLWRDGEETRPRRVRYMYFICCDVGGTGQCRRLDRVVLSRGLTLD